jgi:hypothetical protein
VREATWTTKKCTESVSPSSDFPIDLRRSDCLSESHQPRALRARCKAHTTGSVTARQGTLNGECRKLRSFLFAQAEIATRAACSKAVETRTGRQRRPEKKNSPSRERFRPPSRLTFRFRVVPLGRASTYRRPVLGAGGLYAHPSFEIKSARERISRSVRLFAPGRWSRGAISRSSPARSRRRARACGGRARGGARRAR